MKKKSAAILAIIVMAIVIYSCKKNTSTEALKGATLSLPATPDTYFPVSTFGNSDSLNRVATLGRVLFYDSHLSLNNAISCGSCHHQAIGFADNVAFSTGYEGLPTKRNSLAVCNLGSGPLFWDGREDNVNDLALRPITNHVEMGMDSPDVLPAKLAALPYYGQLFMNSFGDSAVTMVRISSAIGTFISAITATNSRLDQYEAGNTSVLTAQEIEGKMLFDSKYNCSSCHDGGGIVPGGGGYTGGGFSFLDIGLDATYTDMGRGTITGLSTDNGTFKVPDLHNVAITPPYMHDGRYATLSDVIDHYSHNIQNSPNLDPRLKDNTGNPLQMNITDNDKQAIIAFLNTLTDYTVITDPKFSTPFKVN
jgi:cytochrome c peroxidase